jgi:hypothetical protein
LLAGQETEPGLTLMREVINSKPDFADANTSWAKPAAKRGM